MIRVVVGALHIPGPAGTGTGSTLLLQVVLVLSINKEVTVTVTIGIYGFYRRRESVTAILKGHSLSTFKPQQIQDSLLQVNAVTGVVGNIDLLHATRFTC